MRGCDDTIYYIYYEILTCGGKVGQKENLLYITWKDILNEAWTDTFDIDYGNGTISLKKWEKI